MAEPIIALLLEARHALVWHQGDLANLLKLSRRTVQRWDAGHGSPDATQLATVARAVFPKDAELASRLARAARTSLEELGLVITAAPQTPISLLGPLMVDSITCAAADAMNMAPDAVRPALRAAFERARDLGLSPADVASALGSSKRRRQAGAR